jgi:3-hydroxyisobutyrate dehydrogenase-like beta-hydroxyacid dehydrogenase
MSAPTIAALGLGEAGSALALGLLEAGADVRGYDPAVRPPPGVCPCHDEADAAQGSDLVLSVNSAEAAVPALHSGLRSADRATIWADLNTAAPGTKRELAAHCAERNVPFADIAIMAPVPGLGLRVPMLAAGTGAASAAELLTAVGAVITVLDRPAGAAAERKLMRSVFFKGMSAAATGTLCAGWPRWRRRPRCCAPSGSRPGSPPPATTSSPNWRAARTDTTTSRSRAAPAPAVGAARV